MDNQNSQLNNLPPPPQGQTGMTLDAFKHLPPPPQGQQGMTLDQINQSSNQSSQPPQKSFLQKAGDVVNSIFPGKQVGQAIGTLGGLGITAGKEALGMAPKGATKAYDTSAPSPLQVAGDIGQGALTIAAPEIGNGATTGGRIAANAALGAGLGGTNAIAQGQSAKDVAKSTVVGGALGGGVSAAGEGLKALTENLPRWLTKAALPKLDSKNIDYALQNTNIGGLQSMATKSNSSMQNYESQIQNILSHPEHTTVPEYTPASLLGKTLEQFPNSEYTPNDIIKNAQNLAPKVGKLLTKFEAGTANLQEINSIRKELDAGTKSVYTSLNRPPESKMLGAALSNTLRNLVQTSAPDTAPIFQNYAKEIGLNKALESAIKKGETKVSLKDMIAAGGGFASGGLQGALEAVVAERLLTNPGGQIGIAKGIQAAGKYATPIAKTAFQGLKAPLIKQATNSQQ